MVEDTAQAGYATMTSIVSHNWMHLNDSIIDQGGLEPGVYLFRILDSLYQQTPYPRNRDHEYYKYFFVGEEGETTSGMFHADGRYYESIEIIDDLTDSSETIENLDHVNNYLTNPKLK
jgi:hypothetical protein